jgi:hypothetical protein
MAVVGEGRERFTCSIKTSKIPIFVMNRFGHVFLFDTGTSNGNLSGQSKTMTVRFNLSFYFCSSGNSCRALISVGLAPTG